MEVSLNSWEAAIRRREDAVEKREDAVAKREDAVAKREDAVGKREEIVRVRWQNMADAMAAREGEMTSNEAMLEPKKGRFGFLSDHVQAFGASDYMSNSREAEKGRHVNPLDDVPGLVDSFHASGGVVPMDVVVAEVQNLMRALASRWTNSANTKDQIEQLEKNYLKLQKENDEMAKQMFKPVFENKLDQLKKAYEKAQNSIASEEKRFEYLRLKGIKHFVPLLLQTVTKFEGIFESMIHDDIDGEELLKDISNLSSSIRTKGQELRQLMPSAYEPNDTKTLMMLYDIAIQATPKLECLAQDAVSRFKGLKLSKSPNLIKGMARLLQKVQEEYEGDYTRILDFSRVSIVCENLKGLYGCLSWLMDPSQKRRFRCCRIKDRLSRKWDVEKTGGNRDILINGWLNLGGGRWFIVEVQLHLSCLFELKKNLHVLYEGIRVLGASKNIDHFGELTKKEILKTRDGIVRRLVVWCSSVEPEIRDQLIEMLHSEPCSILKLSLNNCKCNGKSIFEGMTLDKILAPYNAEMIACRRIQEIRFGGTGLTGKFSELKDLMLNKCTKLTKIGLSRNKISGQLAAWIGQKTTITDIILYRNRMDGPIPKEIGNCVKLEHLHLSENLFNGSIPKELGNCIELKSLGLHHTQLRGSIPVELANLSQLTYLNISNCQLSGNIPDSISKLSSLEYLDISMNQLSGAVPVAALAKLSELKRIGLIFPADDWCPKEQISKVSQTSFFLTQSNTDLRITKEGIQHLRESFSKIDDDLRTPRLNPKFLPNPGINDDTWWPQLTE